MTTRSRKLPVAMAAMFVFAACGGGGSRQPAPQPLRRPPRRPAASAEAPASASAAGAVTIELAHSYQDAQPQVACGAKIIADEVAAADVGLTIEIFGQSQLGSDADRIESVVAGDIDMDIQGASALSAIYAPDRRRRRRVRVRRQRAHAPLLQRPGVRRPQAGLPRRDGRANPRRLEHRRPPVHGQQADPHARRPRRPADALPAVAAVPDERRGDGREPGRGRVRGALPRAPAGDRRRAGEPAHQHPGDQPARGPGLRQPVEPPAQLEPGRDRQGLGHAQPGAAGSAHGRGREGHGRGARSAWSRPRPTILDGVRAPAAPWRSSRTSTARRSAPRRSRTSGSNFTPEQVEVLDAIRSTAQ